MNEPLIESTQTMTMEELTVIEKTNLEDLEQKLEKLKATVENTFYEIGSILSEIRDNRYYRETHSTFEQYCNERWGFTKSRANQLISAFEVADNLTTTVAISEGTIRPLTKLSPEQQREVYEAAVATAPEGKVTAKHIEETIKKKNPTNHDVAHLSVSFKAAWDGLVEEIKRENLNGWKETNKKDARVYMQKLVNLVK